MSLRTAVLTTPSNEQGKSLSIDWTGGKSGNSAQFGQSSGVRWASATIDSSTHTINISLKLNFSKYPDMTSEQTNQLFGMVRSGVEQFWNGNLDLNGETWQIKTTTSLSKEGMPMDVHFNSSKELKRSVNSGIGAGDLYYNAGFFDGRGRDGELNFKITSAHEIGHEIVQKNSWGHKGTSTWYGDIKSSAPQYPKDGPIDLMRYYNGTIKSYDDLYNRTRAAREDVMNLLFMSKK